MTIVTPTISPAAERMRRSRQRRREGLRSLRVELRETEIDALIHKGLLKAESRDNAGAVLRRCRFLPRAAQSCVWQAKPFRPRLYAHRYRVHEKRPRSRAKLDSLPRGHARSIISIVGTLLVCAPMRQLIVSALLLPPKVWEGGTTVGG
jgi:hypothetical protein